MKWDLELRKQNFRNFISLNETKISTRNVFDEWGLELRGGFGDGQSFMGEPSDHTDHTLTLSLSLIKTLSLYFMCEYQWQSFMGEPSASMTSY